MYEWHGTQYVGPAHGVTGILHLLLQAKEYLPENALERLVRDSIEVVVSWQMPGGNFPSSLPASGRDKLVHFCHGAPGVAQLFLKAYEIFDQPRYLEVARHCCECIWWRGLLKKGYGLCHGIAGNAVAFFRLHQLTGGEKWLEKGLLFADRCTRYDIRLCDPVPDDPFSLMNGLAGNILFLTMVKEGKVIFPCLDI